MKLIFSLFALFFTCSLFAQPDVDIEAFGPSTFNSPVAIKHAGDSRLFIVEQGGRIKILNDDGTINATNFLNISSLISSGGERGLLGLAFHPDYATNGYFYVNYTNTSGDTVIARYSVSSNPDIADASSAFTIITISQPYSNHNAGDLAFGPDGYLYIPMGDGGSGGDPQNFAQNLNSLLGKLLRIDVDNTNGGNNYAIPADNPYVSGGGLPEIWAYGLRNPWRFSFDSLTGDIWIGDVGQNAIEELNFVPYTQSNVNYGWRCYEGTSNFNTSGCPPITNTMQPVFEYQQSTTGGCSVVGGYRYRGSMYPNFNNLYFFTDYCHGDISYLEFNGTSWVETKKAFSGDFWSAFGEDVNGELYLASIFDGQIFKLKDNNLSIDDVNNTANSFTMLPNPSINGNVTLSSNLSISTITIHNILGQIVTEKTNVNTTTIQLNLKNNSGVYLVKVTFNNNTSVLKKLVIN